MCAAIAAVATVTLMPLLPSQLSEPVVPLGATNDAVGIEEKAQPSLGGNLTPMLPPTGISPCV